MLLKKPRLSLCCRCRPATPEIQVSLQTRVWLILLGILLISAFVAHRAGAGSKIMPQEKGLKAMQQVAPVLKNDLPPIDASQPARTETFTFGLG